MEIFIQTNDGRYAALRHRGVLHYGITPDALAQRLGIVEYQVQVDPNQPKRRPLPRVARGVAGFNYFST